MENEVISTASVFAQFIDCRMLGLYAYCRCISDSSLPEIAEEFYSLISSLFHNNSVMHWTLHDRVLKRPIREMMPNITNTFDLTVEGNIISETIHNRTTQIQYERKLYHNPIFSLIPHPAGAAVNYPSYYAQKIQPTENTNSNYQEALIKLFNEENKVGFDFYLLNCDFMGMINFSRSPKTNEWMGHISLEISTYSLGTMLDSTAEKLWGFAQVLSELAPESNVTIGINVTENDHHKYFPNLNVSDSARDYLHMPEYAYLKQVGWMNIISRSLFKKVKDEIAALQGIEIVPTGNGCALCRFKAGISQLTIAGLKEMKKALYPALYPGYGKFPRGWKFFRSYWEYVPVLDDEISVNTDGVSFCIQNKVDEKYLESFLVVTGDDSPDDTGDGSL